MQICLHLCIYFHSGPKSVSIQQENDDIFRFKYDFHGGEGVKVEVSAVGCVEWYWANIRRVNSMRNPPKCLKSSVCVCICAGMCVSVCAFQPLPDSQHPPKPLPSLFPWKLCPFLFFSLPCTYGASHFLSVCLFLLLHFHHPPLHHVCCISPSFCAHITHDAWFWMHAQMHALQAPQTAFPTAHIRCHTYIQYDDHISSQWGYG